MVCVLALLHASVSAQDRTPRRLTLADAKQIALANHPTIKSAQLVAAALTEGVAAARSAYFPTFSASVTSVGAGSSGPIAAGALPTSSLADRIAGGVTASQLLTDFGRTRSLTSAATLNVTAQDRHVDELRANVLLEVARSYYESLAADAVLTVARADLESRKLLLRQVTALAQSDLKSTLDVSFADVGVSESELRLERAQSDAQAARARLAAALAETTSVEYELVDEELPDPLEEDVDAAIAEAIRTRPELLASKVRRDSAEQYATAERRLSYPSISLLATAGAVPSHDPRLKNSYGAAGINVSIPVWNGGLFAARHAEAEQRLAASTQDIAGATVSITRDVRVAWLHASSALKLIDVTTRLVEQADTAVRLATARYDVGLSSIVELTLVQLSQTSARIEAAHAKYDYLQRRALLDFAVGRLR
jgi:outer membrane protein